MCVEVKTTKRSTHKEVKKIKKKDPDVWGGGSSSTNYDFHYHFPI